MPRKHPPRGYYDEEEVYDVDHGRPRDRHRSKRDRVIEEEDYPPRRRRASIPPVEEMERMRIKDRRAPSSPEYVRESGRAKGKGKAQPPPPPQELKFRRGRGEVKRSSSIPPPPPSPPSEAERDDYRPSSKGKKSPRGKNGKKAEPDEYIIKDRHGGRRGKAKQIAALMSDSEDDISVKRSSRAAAAAAPPPPPPLPGAMPEDDDDDDESEAEFMRQERRRRKGKMIEPSYSSAVPPPPRFPHKPNMGRHRGKEREDVRRRAASRTRARSLSAPRHVTSESDDSETDTTEETESSTEDSEDEEDEEDDEEDDELVILKDEWGRGNRRSRSLSRPAIKSRRDDSSPGSPSLRELSLGSRHGGRRPKYIEQGYEVVTSPPATGMDLAPRTKKKRSKDDTSLVPRLMDPPEPSRRRKKKAAAAAAAAEEAQLANHKSHAAGYDGRGREVSFREHSRRRSKSARAARDDMDLDVYSRRRPDLPPYAGPPGGPPGADMPYMGPPGTAPGPMGMPHQQPMMPMGRPPHPSEMGWQQPRAVPDPRYYPPSEEYSSEEEDVDDGQLGPGRRYIGMKDHRDRFWTEITKDLVVRDAVERFGYEYEETDSFFYIFSYLHYEDVAALVEMSDQIRHARRRRIHEINRGRGSYPSTHVPPGQGPPPPPAVTGPPQAPIASGPMAPMLPVAPPGVAPVVPAGYERYAAAAPPQQQPPPPPPGMPVGVPGPMMNPAQQPWPSWDGNRGRERDVYNDHHPHHRWRAPPPPAHPAPPGAWPAW